MTFEEWLQTGIANRWVSPPVCAMHEGAPLTEEEEQELDEGYDPCHTVLRVFSDSDECDAAARNSPLVWLAWDIPNG